MGKADMSGRGRSAGPAILAAVAVLSAAMAAGSSARAQAAAGDQSPKSQPADRSAQVGGLRLPAATSPASAASYPQAPPGARITDLGWFAPIVPSSPAPPLPEKVAKAFVIPIQGEIDDTLRDTIARKVDLLRREGAQLVIFQVDSPGGSSDAMNKIVRIIQQDLRDVRTVAYVDPDAYSAAAIISLACNEIVMSPLGNIGAAMPIMVGPQGLMEIPEKERGKFESAMRSQIRVLAQRNGYDQDLCEAMITITMELWLIRNRDSGELRVVQAGEWRGRVASQPGGGQPAPEAPWEYLRLVDGPMELISLTASEASFLGLSRGSYDSLAKVLAHYDVQAPPITLTDVWSERLVGFLTSPAVSGLLLMVAVLSLYVELQHPGISVAGGLALVCFAILFGSRYLIGMAAWWEIAAFAVGLGLIVVELFVIPGFGVAGVLGIILCLLGLVAMIIPNAPDELPIPRSSLDWDVFSRSLLALCLGFIGAFVAIPILARILPRIPMANRLVLTPPSGDLGGSATERAPVLTIGPGQVGVLTTPCRPAGKARFGEEIIDVSSEGLFLAAGDKVRVLRRQGNQVVIEPVDLTGQPKGGA